MFRYKVGYKMPCSEHEETFEVQFDDCPSTTQIRSEIIAKLPPGARFTSVTHLDAPRKISTFSHEYEILFKNIIKNHSKD